MLIDFHLSQFIDYKVKKPSNFIVLGGPWAAAASRIQLFHGPPWHVTNDAAQPVEMRSENLRKYLLPEESKLPLYPLV